MSSERGMWFLSSGIARVLRAGTLLTIALMACGYALTLFDPSPGDTGVPILAVLGRTDAASIIGAGILGLTLVPVAVLIVAAVGFRLLGERRMFLVSALSALLLVAMLVAAVVLAPLG